MATTAKWKRHLSASDRRAKVVIEACVLSGAGIEYLPDAPRFRFTPVEKNVNSFEPVRSSYRQTAAEISPSKRGTVKCGKGNTRKLRTWTPVSLSLAPQYETPMAGDDEELRHARFCWGVRGDPAPLRAYLEKQAAERRAKAHPQRPPEQTELAA